MVFAICIIIALVVGALLGTLSMACLNVARAADDASVRALEEAKRDNSSD